MEIINSELAPKAIGPYSQAIKANGFLFISGQIGFDPVTMELISSDIKAQTNQVLTNLYHILASEKLDFNSVCKTTIFLKNISDFQVVNEIYEMYFKKHKPARSTFQVAALPKDALIEIELIAAF